MHTESQLNDFRSVSIENLLITARKRSLGQGSVFTGVYLSMGGGRLVSQHASQVT